MGADFLRDSAQKLLERMFAADEASLRSGASRAADALLAAPGQRNYTDVPAGFSQGVQELRDRFGPPAQELVLLELARTLPARFDDSGLPAMLWPHFADSVHRIASRADTARWTPRGPRDDIFLKDAAILNLVLIPCVSHVVHRHSGIPRRIALLQRPDRLVRSLAYFRRCGGFAPFLSNHVHPDMTDRFDAAGRAECYRLVARLLEHWPESRGLTGMSWYYDPVVAAISPHLAYLHEGPARAGALFLPGPLSDTVTADATSTSARRRTLHAEGRYQPRQYLMAWSRDALLRAHTP
jgi:hypothetical protein